MEVVIAVPGLFVGGVELITDVAVTGHVLIEVAVTIKLNLDSRD